MLTFIASLYSIIIFNVHVFLNIYLNKLDSLLNEFQIMSSEEQLARTQLRSGFLSVLDSLKGRQAEVLTCEGNSLECRIMGVDRCVENLAVENLQTPAGSVIPHAVLRLPDLDQIVCKKTSE